MDVEEARRRLSQIARSGAIRLTRHCRERMAQRNVNTQDLLQVLFWGEIKDLHEDPEHGNWECLVVGADLEGDPLKVKVALEEDFAVLCITVFG